MGGSCLECAKISVLFIYFILFFIFYFLMQDLLSIQVRRGGIDNGQSHKQWLSTISQSPNVISMSFVPITSLLSGVRGSGFLSHAINLYLRCEYASYFIASLLSLRLKIEVMLLFSP